MDETKKPQMPSVEELRAKGNDCVKDGKFIEAVLHYTQAIKIDPANYVLYSNRSFAFLKLKQHYLSLQDANETVRLQPQWAKGYFRRAEVEAASGLYDESIISYTRALQLEPHNMKLMESIKHITDIQKNKARAQQTTIWVCTCIGLLMGIGIILLDYGMTRNPSMGNPLSMVAFVIGMSGLGWSVGKTAATINSWDAGKSLQPPPDLVTGNENEKEGAVPEKKNKYSKAQARQRYKQGKL